LSPFAFPQHEDRDAEDDTTSTSSLSRFGSIASASSNTSGYYSDVGSEPVYDTDGRRASCGSGPFLELLNGLDVNGQAARDTGPHCTSIDNDMHPPDESDGHPTSTYPSPTSTASPSPHVQDADSSSLPISTSSELAYALQTNEALDGGGGRCPDVSHSPTADDGTVPYFYGPMGASESDTAYPQSSSSSSSGSSMSLPMMEFGEKFQFDMPAPGQYQTMPSYVSPVDAAQYSSEGTFCGPEGQGQDGHLHGMEFAPSSEYAAYNADASVITLEPFHPYT
jgi:hypothetical protein